MKAYGLFRFSSSFEANSLNALKCFQKKAVASCWSKSAFQKEEIISYQRNSFLNFPVKSLDEFN